MPFFVILIVRLLMPELSSEAVYVTLIGEPDIIDAFVNGKIIFADGGTESLVQVMLNDQFL
jgi:hypothetical protein